MFTAMQSAHLDRANALHEARTKLFGCIALICTDASDRQRIYTAIEAIDLMLAESVPMYLCAQRGVSYNTIEDEATRRAADAYHEARK